MIKLRLWYYNPQHGCAQSEHFNVQSAFFNSPEELANALVRFYHAEAPHLELISIKEVCQFERDLD